MSCLTCCGQVEMTGHETGLTLTPSAAASLFAPRQLVQGHPLHGPQGRQSCPQSRIWPLALIALYQAFTISKISSCQPCKLCLWRMEVGAHLSASAQFARILPCFLVISGGKVCCKLFGLSANPSLMIRTLPKISLFFSITSKGLCTANPWVIHSDSVMFGFPEYEQGGTSFDLLGAVYNLSTSTLVAPLVGFHSSKEQFQHLRNPMLNDSFIKKIPSRIAVAIKLRKVQFALTLSSVSLYFLGNPGVFLLLMFTLDRASSSFFIFGIKTPKGIYTDYPRKCAF